MSYCSNCGGAVTPNASACGNCGATLGQSSQAAFTPPSSTEVKGFVASIFDLSFSHFITAKLVKFLFILGLIGVGVWMLVLIGTAFTQGSTSGILLLLISPLIAAFMVIYLRVIMEMLIVVFRAAEHLRELVELTRQRG